MLIGANAGRVSVRRRLWTADWSTGPWTIPGGKPVAWVPMLDG